MGTILAQYYTELTIYKGRSNRIRLIRRFTSAYNLSLKRFGQRASVRTNLIKSRTGNLKLGKQLFLSAKDNSTALQSLIYAELVYNVQNKYHLSNHK